MQKYTKLVNLSPQLRSKLERLAKQQDRDVNWIINHILLEHFANEAAKRKAK